MILSRLKNALNNNNGMALIVALCVATFIMALSLALVFSTAQISSNINNKLLREQAQQQASSFADVLVQQMGDNTSEFYTAVNNLCNSDSAPLGEKCSLDLVVPDAYKSKRYGSVKVMLTKTESSVKTSTDSSDWADYSGDAENGYIYNPIDYDVNVTVVVTMEQGIFATVTDTYERSTKYQYEYVLRTDGDEGEVYELDADSGRFKRSNTNDYLKDASGGTDATLAKLSESKGKIDDNISLVRKRVANSGESIFTFQGRE